MTDIREIQAVEAWWSLPKVGERTLLSLMDHALESRRTLAELWLAPIEDLRALTPLPAAAATAMQLSAAERWRSAGESAASVRHWGVDLLLPTSPDYPAALSPEKTGGRRRPAVYAYGALDLFEEPRVALLNSKSPSNAGLAATEAIADALARRDVALLASINRESYQAAAVAAKRHAGPAVLVLDRGIAEAFPAGLSREPVAQARVWDAAFDPDLQLLLSPFPWRGGWHQRSGPLRDALIADLATTLIAVDVRPGGTVERECRRAAERGAVVLALDHGEETLEGTRGLWESGGAVRVPWRGAEAAVAEVLKRGPSLAAQGESRGENGRQKELAGFLARVCEVLDELPRQRVVGAYPAGDAFGKAAQAWGRAGGDASAGVHWLLADLSAEGAADRPGRLLQRVSRGGLLAAIVPSMWLESGDHAAARSLWLKEAALRAIVSLPAPVGDRGGRTCAIFLQRDGRSEQSARTFAPEQAAMGRFHLRRYLREVLDALGSK